MTDDDHQGTGPEPEQGRESGGGPDAGSHDAGSQNAGSQNAAPPELPHFGGPSASPAQPVPQEAYPTSPPPTDPSAPPQDISSPPAPETPASETPAATAPGATESAPAGATSSASQEAAAAARALRTQLTGLGIANPLPAVAVSALSYVAALVTSVVVLVVLAIGLAVSSLGSAPSDLGEDVIGTGGTEALSGVGALLRLPFQLVSLAAFGSYGAEATVPFAGQVGVSLRALPFLVTVALVAFAYFGARFVQRRRVPAGAYRDVLGALISALAGGLTAAILVVLLARITAQPVPAGEMGTFGVHAAGVDAFFGALVLVGGALLCGQLRALPRPAWLSPLTVLGGGLRLAAVHAVVVTVVVGLWLWLVFAVQSVLDGDLGMAFAPVFLAPLLIGQLLAYVPGLGMLSSASYGISGSAVELLGGGAMTERLWIGDLPWYAGVGAILLSLASVVVLAVLWNRARPAGGRSALDAVAGMVALPLGYLVGACVLMILGWSRVGVSISNLGDGAASLALAAWTPALALAVGIVVELIARLLAPVLAPFVPEVLVGWFRVTPPVAAAAGTAGATAGAAAAASAGGQGMPSAAEGAGSEAPPAPAASAPARQPLSAKARKRLLLGALSTGALLVLAVGGVVAYSIVSATVFSPSKEVEAYLGAVEAGQFDRAAEISAPNVSNGQRVLLTEEIGQATEGGLTGHTVGEVEKDGDSATVAVTLDEDGLRTEETYTLTRSGRSFGIFPEWTLEDVAYREVTVHVPDEGGSIDVNGVTVDLAGAPREMDEEGFGVVTLPVLPGDYTISYTDTHPYVTQTPHELQVPVASTGDEQLGVWRDETVNEEGIQAVQDEVDAMLDTCAEQTVGAPEGCPFSVWTSADEGTWEITGYPQITLENYGEGYYYLSTDFSAHGSATFTYEQDWFGEAEETTSDTTISVNAMVVFTADGDIEIEYQ